MKTTNIKKEVNIMTTYQDIVNYLKEHYLVKEYTVIKHDDYYTITNGDNGDITIDIYNDCYKSSMYIGTKLSRLLVDLLDTPVNQRNKRINSEIKHTSKPMTKESVYNASLITSADQVIQAINTFLVNARCNSNPNPIMTIATDIGVDNLNKVLKLYDDYNIEIINQIPNSNVFNLFIEPN